MNSTCSHDSCFLSDRKHSSSRRFLLKKKSHLLMFWFSQQLQFNFFSINSQTRKCSMAVCLFLSLQSLVKRFHAHETIFINVSLFIDKHPIVFLGTKRETKEGIVLYGNMTQLLMLCLYNDLPICVLLSPASGFISSSSFYLPYLHNTKNLFTAVIARRRGDPGSQQAYERGTSLKLMNEVKKKCSECAAWPIQ